MPLSFGLTNSRLRHEAPLTRFAAPLPKPAPLWPTFSIAFLLCLPTFFAPIALTVFNAILVGLATLVILFSRSAIDRRLLIIASLLTGVTFFGLITGAGYGRYDYFKDMWYVLNPLLVMLTGYVLYRLKPDLARILRAFVIAGVIVALWQSRGYVIDPSIITLSAVTIRQIVGTGSPVPILALSILIVHAFCLKQGLKLQPWLAVIAFSILALSVAGTFSRTAVVLVLIALAAAAGCFVKREWMRVAFPVIILLFLSQLASVFLDTESAQARESFGGKLLRSVTELTTADNDLRSINLNFRAYETDRVKSQFLASEPLQMLLGQGFGATVDLGLTMPLAISETGYRGVRHIGIFHNGYMFLLTKVGIAGLMLYLIVLAYMYFIPRENSRGSVKIPSVAAARVFQMAVVSLAATTYIVGGIFNRDGMFPFLLLAGCLLAHFAEPQEKLPHR